MNTFQRRQVIKARVIDVAVAKVAVNESRRERAEAAKKLRKALAAARFTSVEAESISYPRQAVG